MDDFDLASRPIPAELQARLEAELETGERLLWAGQPRPWKMVLVSLPILLFAIPWLAFSVFWMTMATFGAFAAGRGGEGVFGWGMLVFPLFGLPFVLIGLLMLSAPYWALRVAKRTCYALTDRRAMIIESPWSAFKVRSFFPKDMNSLTRTENRDGSGDLIFREVSVVDRDNDRSQQRIGFKAIDRVRDVEHLLRERLLTSSPSDPT